MATLEDPNDPAASVAVPDDDAVALALTVAPALRVADALALLFGLADAEGFAVADADLLAFAVGLADTLPPVTVGEGRTTTPDMIGPSGTTDVTTRGVLALFTSTKTTAAATTRTPDATIGRHGRPELPRPPRFAVGAEGGDPACARPSTGRAADPCGSRAGPTPTPVDSPTPADSAAPFAPSPGALPTQ